MLNLYFSAFIAIANELVDKCNLPGKVSRLEECRDSFFVGVYIGLLGDDLPGKINKIPFMPSHAIFHMVHKSRKFEEFRPLYAILWCIRTILSVCVCCGGWGCYMGSAFTGYRMGGWAQVQSSSLSGKGKKSVYKLNKMFCNSLILANLWLYDCAFNTCPTLLLILIGCIVEKIPAVFLMFSFHPNSVFLSSAPTTSRKRVVHFIRN